MRLDVRIDGFPDPVGQLVRDAGQSLSFAYHQEHLAIPTAMAVSLSLPLRREAYSDVVVRAFFDNLLSEQHSALRSVMDRHSIPRDDVAGLLFHMGKDCAGALSVLPEGAPPTRVPGNLAKDYKALSQTRLAEIVQSLYERRRLPDDVQDPSPLAGVQSKVALARLSDGRLAEPTPGSGAPTTHILKVPERGHEHDVDRELLALQLSAPLVATASAERVDYGGVPALLVARFDRSVLGGVVRRLHQEDFAQALGLPSLLKYERNGTAEKHFSAAAAATLLRATVNPVGSVTRFLAGAIFDLLIGNVDAHAKNHALLHLGPGRVDLAPRYDLLPTRLNPNLTDLLAYRIGDAIRLADVTGEDFDAFLRALGFVTMPARRRVRDGLGRGIVHALGQKLDGIGSTGQKAFADLIASNMRMLLPEIGLEVPQSARDRDAAISRGGGWAAS